MSMYSNFSLLLLIYFDRVKTQYPWFLSMPRSKVVGNFKARNVFCCSSLSSPQAHIVYRLLPISQSRYTHFSIFVMIIIFWIILASLHTNCAQNALKLANFFATNCPKRKEKKRETKLINKFLENFSKTQTNKKKLVKFFFAAAKRLTITYT